MILTINFGNGQIVRIPVLVYVLEKECFYIRVQDEGKVEMINMDPLQFGQKLQVLDRRLIVIPNKEVESISVHQNNRDIEELLIDLDLLLKYGVDDD